MRKLNPREKLILMVLVEHNYYLTTTQVAELADVSWNTAENYLNKFFEAGWINKRSRGRWLLWKAVPPES